MSSNFSICNDKQYNHCSIVWHACNASVQEFTHGLKLMMFTTTRYAVVNFMALLKLVSPFRKPINQHSGRDVELLTHCISSPIESFGYIVIVQR